MGGRGGKSGVGGIGNDGYTDVRYYDDLPQNIKKNIDNKLEIKEDGYVERSVTFEDRTETSKISLKITKQGNKIEYKVIKNGKVAVDTYRKKRVQNLLAKYYVKGK